MLRGWVIALGVCLFLGVLTTGCKGGGGMGNSGSGGVDGSAGDGVGNKDGAVPLDHPPACVPTSKHGITSLGKSCACDSDCGSGFCVEGLCCESACGDTCHSCNLPGTEGTCELVPAGAKPRAATECGAQPDSTCGRDGTCDGKGGCRSHVRGTMCFAGTCDGDGIAGVKVCDGKGSCGPGPAVTCAPYACAGDKCPSSCTTDGDCSAGHNCKGKSCGTLPNGRACKADEDCSSSHCADGVCCNVACGGECVSCDQPDSVGQCRPLGQGLPDDKCPAQNKSTCGTTGLCDGFGACALFAADVACIPPNCSGHMLNTAGTCDGLGTCRPPGQIDCAPFSCQQDACVKDCASDGDCVAPNSCINGSCGKKPMGSPCGGGTQCESGQCVDGVCCDSACTGACQSCALQSSLGHCTNVGAGAADVHNICKDNGASSCGTDGKCDGKGACRKYPEDTVCGAEMCVGGAYTAPPTCNAGGQCIPPGGQTCFPYACNGSKCFTACTTNSQCGGTNSCVNGSCGLKPPGAACSAANECQAAPDGHQYCSQGVCCNNACGNACQACNLAASRGTCTAVAQNVVDPQGKCANTPQAMCGTNGKCRVGGCDVYHTTDQCAPVGCASATTQYLAAFCGGNGTACPGRIVMSCGAFGCDPATGTCRNSCKVNGDCASPNTCINNSCGLKSNGAACSVGTECGSGNCTEGVCCNTSCSQGANGTCLSCKVMGSVGTCSPVPLHGLDPGARCPTSLTSSCGTDGTCDGAGKCHNWDTTTVCRLQSCTGATLTNPAKCDGKGACPLATTSSCDPFVCSLNACLTTCNSAADCNTGIACNTQTNKCGDKLPAGKVCSVGTDCASTFCVKNLPTDATGLCCDKSCTSGCQSCALAGSQGTCTNIPVGTLPRTSTMCPSSPPCGNTGNCDGIGGCQFGAGQCRAPSCPTPTSQIAAASCPGGGASCPVMVTTPCAAGYLCTGTACATMCSSNAACDTASGYTCVNSKCVLPQANGQACNTANTPNSGADCTSGFCVSASATGAAGICCASTCPADTSMGGCGNTGACRATGTTGAGTCAPKASGTTCGSAMCAGSVLTSSRTCNGAGQCTMGSTTDCAPYSCSTTGCNDPCSMANPCVNGYTCSAGVCLANDGQACMTDPGCLHGHCAGGICCATACPAGNACVTTACQASGAACVPAAVNTSCGPGSCIDPSSGTSDLCDGMGACNPVPFTCTLPLMCDATTPPASCL